MVSDPLKGSPGDIPAHLFLHIPISSNACKDTSNRKITRVRTSRKEAK
jgi:hypothetical protein